MLVAFGEDKGGLRFYRRSLSFSPAFFKLRLSDLVADVQRRQKSLSPPMSDTLTKWAGPGGPYLRRDAPPGN